ELVDYRRLHSVRLRRRHATERLERQHHVAELVDRVVDVLADFEVSLAATCELVIERMRHSREFILRGETVRDPSEFVGRAVIEEIPHPLACANAPQLLA